MIARRYFFILVYMFGYVAGGLQHPIWYWDLLRYLGIGVLGYAIILIVEKALEKRSKEQKILSDYYKKEKKGEK